MQKRPSSGCNVSWRWKKIPRLPKWPEITWTSSKTENQHAGLHVLGINPWIYDFAAFNLWSRPAGLLICLDLMRSSGCKVALLDCLHPTWRDISWPKAQKFGTGHYPKTPLPKPWVLQDVPRRYSRYGLPFSAVDNALRLLRPKPDLILLTSGMTYWYPGVLCMERLLRRIWPKTPLILGGLYPTLCPEHAQKHSLSDLVLQGPLEEKENWQKLWRLTGCNPGPQAPTYEPNPAQDLYPQKDFSIILGSRGCPFDCTYCATSRIYPGFVQSSLERIWESFVQEMSLGVHDFAFYDDALLYQPQQWLIPFLGKIGRMQKKPRLHTPNAMHARYLQGRLPAFLQKAGLCTVRLGLETADFARRKDAKLNQKQWSQAVEKLFQAEFKPQQVGAYILFGLPGQDPEEIEQAIRFAQDCCVQPILAHYSPIPGTMLFEQAKEHSPYPLAEEPLCQNSSIWPCYPGGFSWGERQKWQRFLQGSMC
ncbi:MAG: B12-binding domain-containing radical SAM protein [Desulfohalobiaceae bacterium]